jgi:uncharacterized protein YbbC (DUF1343 family)
MARQPGLIAWSLGVVALVMVWTQPASSAADAADWGAIDAAVRDAVTLGDLPGGVVLVGRGDRILYRKAFGSRALVPAVEPATIDTVFDVASLTKVVATTPAVLALWEKGRIDLDAPIGRYLSEFAGPRHREVTVRRVLTHSAGFPDLPPAQSASRGMAAALAAIARQELQSTPGSTFRYSDTGFIVLGELVRRVSGEGLDQFTRQRFYAPLGMAHTTFRPPVAWRAQIAPTELIGRDAGRGVVHDGNARALGGVAGHAGVFSTADDLARFCRMLLARGALDGHRVLAAATVDAMFTPTVIGETTRGLGWDMSSSYSRPLGSFFPPGSGGHTGFTGTSMWLDPSSRTYAILLTNRVHPDGKGKVVDLRRRVSAAVGAALFAQDDAPPAGAPSPGSPAADGEDPTPRVGGPTRTGLDQLVAEGFASLAGRSIGLITNQTGIDAKGRRGADLLAAAPGVKLRALFSPEHGLTGVVDANVPHGRDAATGLPVWSLYGAERRPSSAMLAGIDTLVFDIQDVGARYYTYLATLVYVMEEAARRGIAVVVLDRPNPITGRLVEGPLMDPDLRSFTAPHTVPVRLGMTIGEFARMVAAERRIPVSLTVVPLHGWDRARWFDETGLPWVNPSPNIRTPMQALLYSGIGLLEATNVSVGRGTDMPFEVVGAPWMVDPAALAQALNARGLPGVSFEPARFTPTSSVYANEAVRGVRVVVTDREALRPVRMALAIARELIDRYPTYFRPAAIQNLMVNRSTIWSLLRGDPLPRLWSWAEANRATFLHRRASYLIY